MTDRIPQTCASDGRQTSGACTADSLFRGAWGRLKRRACLLFPHRSWSEAGPSRGPRLLHFLPALVSTEAGDDECRKPPRPHCIQGSSYANANAQLCSRSVADRSGAAFYEHLGTLRVCAPTSRLKEGTFLSAHSSKSATTTNNLPSVVQGRASFPPETIKYYLDRRGGGRCTARGAKEVLFSPARHLLSWTAHRVLDGGRQSRCGLRR